MKKVMLVFGPRPEAIKMARERIPETAKTGRDCGVRNRTASGNAGSGVEDIRHQTGL